MENSESKLRILLLSDQVIERLYSKHINQLFPDVDMIISCGDLPYYYLEFILDTLNVPMYFVHGNHDSVVEIGERGERKAPWGAENLHRKVVFVDGLILAGFEGSIRYSKAHYQFTQAQAWMQVLLMAPRLLWNRIRYGRFLDILVTHSPAYDVSDKDDHAHTGFQAYRWLIKTFKPRYHFHGHVHIYENQGFSPEHFMETTIVNACPYRIVEVDGELLNG